MRTPDTGIQEAGTPDRDASSLAPGKLVFATSEVYSAALGGIDGADAVCTSHAQAAGLSGEFRAWLSTATDPVGERLHHAAVPYLRTDGVVVADGWDDLTDGTLAAPIARDEFGALATGDVWTGTLLDGAAYVSNDCNGFTHGGSDDIGLCGNTATTDLTWTENLLPNCATRLRLFCFQQ